MHCIAAVATTTTPRGYGDMPNSALRITLILCCPSDERSGSESLEAAFAWAADIFFTERAQGPQLEMLELLSCLALAADLFEQVCPASMQPRVSVLRQNPDILKSWHTFAHRA